MKMGEFLVLMGCWFKLFCYYKVLLILKQSWQIVSQCFFFNLFFENQVNRMGNINSVKNVVVISLFMIILVSGFCIFVLMLFDSNIGIKFNVDVIVVINIGLSLDMVLLKVVLLIGRLFLIC